MSFYDGRNRKNGRMLPGVRQDQHPGLLFRYHNLCENGFSARLAVTAGDTGLLVTPWSGGVGEKG